MLAVKHRQIPASLHYQQPNPKIDFANSPFYVNATLADWPTTAAPRRAGVSSFGIGGTNAHVILEEAPAPVREPADSQPQLLVLSAKTPTALAAAAENLAAHLKDLKQQDLEPTARLADIAYTLQMGRAAFDYRRSLVCDGPEDAITQLQIPVSSQRSERPERVLLFPGQGSQHRGMAQGLYQQQPVFKASLDRCAALLAPELDYPLLDLLFSPDQPLDQTRYAQPAIFAVEYSLAQLWQYWGVTPEAMVGHSIGEYVAACLAGVFDLETALRLVALRGRLMQQQPSGAMLSVGLSVEAIQPWLSDQITLAAHNGPQLCVVSGQESAIEALRSQLEQAQISCRVLRTSHAFHSAMMEPMVAPLVEAVSQVTLSPPQVPFISNVTGTWITPEQACDPAYWGQQARQPVRFSDGIKAVLQMASPVLLEVGPGQTLTTLTRQHVALTGGCPTIHSLPHPKLAGGQADLQQLLAAAGQLWCTGVTLNWTNLHHQPGHRVPLPTYPFERQRYWIDMDMSQASVVSATSPTGDIPVEPDLANWFYTPSWQRVAARPRSVDVTTRPRWLIVAQDLGLGSALAQHIEQTGQDVFVAEPGKAFDQAGYRRFEVNPEQAESYQQLWDDLQLREMLPTDIVYLASAGQARDLQFSGLSNLLTVWSRENEPLQITVVTQDSCDVTGSETLSPESSVLQGLCQVVSQEYPQLGCRLGDLSGDPSGDLSGDNANRSTKQQVTLLWQELQATDPAAVVAYRGRYRWQQQYQPVSLTAEFSTALKQGGTYAIVGDYQQGLGPVWGESLAQRHQAKLALIVPQAADGIDTVHLLEKGAASEIAIPTALTTPEALAAALTQAEKQLGPINGVFVSSPMTNEKSAAPLALLQPHHWHYNRDTKTVVLENLATTLAGRTLDFCCVQSSLSSVLGGLGLAPYAGANHFVDAFVADQNRQSGTPWFSINWDAWTEETTADTRDESWGTTLREFALNTEDVWMATERILSLTASGQVAVSKGNLPARISQWIAATPQMRTEAVATSHQRPALAAEYVAPRNDVEQTIAIIWQDLLGIEQVGVYDGFFDLGGHSLLAIQVISRLREAFPVDVEMRNLLFEAPTVAGIAAVISEQLPQSEELDAMAALLAEVQNLSSEEVQAQLAGGEV